MSRGISTKGLTETMKMFEQLAGDTDEIVEKAIKEGIGIVTDEMRREISSLKTSADNEGGKQKQRYPSKKDIKGLLDSLGFTPVKLNGSKFDIKSGFDGYNSVITKKYPQGHPNQMIANSINKGTSFMSAQPFINRTKKASQQQAVDAIDKVITKEIARITK